MTFTILGPWSSPEELACEGGGKAARLRLLEQLGCAVPPWICIPARAFDSSLALMDRPESGAQDTAAEARPLAMPMPDDVGADIREALVRYSLDDEFVAVRSSGLDEDGAEHSFAGQFESFLYRRGPSEVLHAVRDCWASAFSERNMAYRSWIDAQSAGPRMGVIVQRMVDSESAGVAFSRDPLQPAERKMLVVESVWGQGEGLVSGALDSDRFHVNRETLESDVTLATKTHALFRDPEKGGTRSVAVEPERAEQASLAPEQVREVARLALRLEAELGGPQDCEWAYAGGELFVLQTRPITTLPPAALFDPDVAGDEAVIWDNSNIIESYAGVTTPLTFSHVSRSYREVYYQTCRIMGVPPAVIQVHEPVFRNMLGLVRGRVYYNLVNWYRLLSLFPLLGRSKGFMDTMMGVRQSLTPELAELFDPLDRTPRYGLLRRLALVGRLVHRMAGGSRANVVFLRRVDRVCRPLEETDLGELSLPAQAAVYQSLQDDVLRHWTAPIVNDTRCMLAFGLLKALTEKWVTASADAGSLQNDLLCGEGDLKSTEPLRLLLEIARDISTGDEAVRDRFLADPADGLWTALQSGFAPDLAARFEDYVRRYGCRCVDELKLETLDLHDQPHMVVASVQGYLRHGVPSTEEMKGREVSIRREAEDRVRQTLRGPRRVLYFAVLRWARRAISDRELLRFERTRTFGVTRRLFRGMGGNLARLGLLDDEKDIFYLTVDELLGFVEGRPGSLDLRGLAAVRRREFDEYRNSPAPPDRFLTRGAAGASMRYPALLLDHDLLTELRHDDPDTLVGTPCCPGVVEAPVWVADRFEDTEGLSGQILVTERTDPGWIPVFPACAGLIIERGSLLSHSAVVARELGIPTIVGVSGEALGRLQSGQRVLMDAGRGEVRIL
ncbi:MAG: PEP/pyruvate-binding domain-containing protein [Gemmatimonadota bacterium]